MFTSSEGDQYIHGVDVGVVVFDEFQRNHFTPHSEGELHDGLLFGVRDPSVQLVVEEPPPDRLVVASTQSQATLVRRRGRFHDRLTVGWARLFQGPSLPLNPLSNLFQTAVLVLPLLFVLLSQLVFDSLQHGQPTDQSIASV